MGKLRVVAPPSRQGKTSPPPFKGWRLFVPPTAVWLKNRAPLLKLPLNILCSPPPLAWLKLFLPPPLFFLSGVKPPTQRQPPPPHPPPPRQTSPTKTHPHPHPHPYPSPYPPTHTPLPPHPHTHPHTPTHTLTPPPPPDTHTQVPTLKQQMVSVTQNESHKIMSVKSTTETYIFILCVSDAGLTVWLYAIWGFRFSQSD